MLGKLKELGDADGESSRCVIDLLSRRAHEHLFGKRYIHIYIYIAYVHIISIYISIYCLYIDTFKPFSSSFLPRQVLGTLASGYGLRLLLQWGQVHIWAECDKARPDTVSVAALGFEAVVIAAGKR